MLRQLVIVALLFGMMSMLPELVSPISSALNPTTMAAFGFIVLAAHTLGKMAGRFGLPHITGYLVTGLLCGPSVLGIIDEGVVGDLRFFDMLAVALIGISAGGALKLDFLRRSARVLFSVMGSQFLVICATITVLVLVFVAPIPAMGLPMLKQSGFGSVLAVALLLAVVGSAFSPAAAFAVVHDTRSRGPVTDAVLGVSILNNIFVAILFAVVLALSQLLMGLSPASGGLVSSVLVKIGTSVGLGLGAGLLLGLYANHVRIDLLLFTTGACFTLTFLANRFQADPVLVFITAGFVVANAFRRGDSLFRVVDKLSRPVYVVFFFVAGAGLHLEALATMWPVAMLLFAGRAFGLYGGTALGVKLSNGPEALARHGWMGFGPQAGIALSLAIVVGNAIPAFGHTIETLAVATIALNELLGPIALQLALRKSGETPSTGPDLPESPRPSPERRQGDHEIRGLPEWLPEPGRHSVDLWGPPVQVDDEQLRKHMLSIKAELNALVSDMRAGLVTRRREEAVRFMGQLRREFLRAHRHSVLAARDATSDEQWKAILGRERSSMASRWEQHILDRAATVDFRPERTTLLALIQAVDKAVASLPEAIEVRLEPSWYQPRAHDPPHLAMARASLRFRRKLLRFLGFERAHTRVVPLRAIASYALSGKLPGHLSEPAGLVAMTERHLLSRARAVFEAYDKALERLREEQTGPDSRLGHLDRLRTELEEDFALAFEELDRMADDTVRVTVSALSRAYRELVSMAEVAGTPDLPPRKYKFSKVFTKRQRAIDHLEDGLAASASLTRAIAASMSMELELICLSSQVAGAVDSAATGLGRDLRGRLTIQLDRVSTTLAQTVADLGGLLETSDQERDHLKNALREVTSPLAHVLDDVQEISQKLRRSLKSEVLLEPLRQSMSAAIDSLTDHFTTVKEIPIPRGRGLPERPVLRDLPFRKTVRAFMDAEVERDLAMLLSSLRTRVDEACRGMNEVERVLSFNVDLAQAELEVLPPGPVPPATAALIGEMLVGTLRRLGNRVHELKTRSSRLSTETEKAVFKAVIDNLRHLTEILVQGRYNELRLRMAQESVSAGGQEIGSLLTGLLRNLEGAGNALGASMGADTMGTARRVLGIAPVPSHEHDAVPRFQPPAEQTEIPAVYRRLFSDQALEAGDLLTGRKTEVDRIRSILWGKNDGTCRAVVVLGRSTIGNRSVVDALLRGIPEKPRLHKLELHSPVDTQFVRERILPRPGRSRPRLLVLQGFHWLFSMRPGGFEPLKTFLDGVVRDRGHNIWLLDSHTTIWSYASRVVTLDDVFFEKVHVGPLNVEQIRQAVLLRHAMSGYKLRFERHPSGGSDWLHHLPGRASPGSETLENSFFKRLHAASGGVLSDALGLWLASISGVDSSTDTVIVTTFPDPPLDALRDLPMDLLLVLRQVAHQGRLTPQDHSAQFSRDLSGSAAHLALLEHMGLLARKDDDIFVFSSGMSGYVLQVLRGKGLVE